MKTKIITAGVVATAMLLTGCNNTNSSKSNSSASASSSSQKLNHHTITKKDFASNNTIAAAAVLNYAANEVTDKSWKNIKPNLNHNYTLNMVTDSKGNIKYYFQNNDGRDEGVTPYYMITGDSGEIVNFYNAEGKQVDKTSLNRIVKYVNENFTKSAWNKTLNRTTVKANNTVATENDSSDSSDSSSSSSKVSSAASLASSSSSSATSSSSSSSSSSTGISESQARSKMTDYFNTTYGGYAAGYTANQLTPSQSGDDLWMFSTPDGTYFWWVSSDGVYAPNADSDLIGN